MIKKFLQWFLDPLIDSSEIKNEAIKKVDKEKGNVFYRKEVTTKTGTRFETIKIPCPSCNKEFEHDVRLGEAEKSEAGELIKFNACCPYCNRAFNGSIQKQSQTWKCDFCSCVFTSKEEAEEHENKFHR